jgi:hypothetical protein
LLKATESRAVVITKWTQLVEKGENMSKKTLSMVVLALAASLLLGVTGAFTEDKVLINGIDANFPSFAFFDKTAPQWLRCARHG